MMLRAFKNVTPNGRERQPCPHDAVRQDTSPPPNGSSYHSVYANLAIAVTCLNSVDIEVPDDDYTSQV